MNTVLTPPKNKQQCPDYSPQTPKNHSDKSFNLFGCCGSRKEKNNQPQTPSGYGYTEKYTEEQGVIKKERIERLSELMTTKDGQSFSFTTGSRNKNDFDLNTFHPSSNDEVNYWGKTPPTSKKIGNIIPLKLNFENTDTTGLETSRKENSPQERYTHYSTQTEEPQPTKNKLSDSNIINETTDKSGQEIPEQFIEISRTLTIKTNEKFTLKNWLFTSWSKGNWKFKTTFITTLIAIPVTIVCAFFITIVSVVFGVISGIGLIWLLWQALRTEDSTIVIKVTNKPQINLNTFDNILQNVIKNPE